MIIDSPAPVRPCTYPVVLFDLDGTLVDPAGGITGGIAQALRALELPVPADAVLATMVGPKLADALLGIAGVPADKVGAVIANYRAWYATRGMAMSRVYPGVRELLAQLRDSGVILAVATQKPEPLAMELLSRHSLAEFFTTIRGAHADEGLRAGDPGYRPGKAEIIAAALTDATAALGADPARPVQAVMVGDRHQDVAGARSNSLACIGVSWGFALDGELARSGAAAVVHSIAELARLLTGAAAQEVHHGAV
ncbi:HAD hydrolase-like protein [Specibacter sp. NPDC057265]|uniref:HAD hydrolase-like protein n=1 Tax=Specibacter sp. NPDC057265 TaxID=3346075 RepID=UPI00363BA844